MSADLSSKIVAMVQMGDPTYVPGQPQDAGTSKTAGLFPRLNLTACPSNVIAATASYCNTGMSFLISPSPIRLLSSRLQITPFLQKKSPTKRKETPDTSTPTRRRVLRFRQ